LGVTAWVWPHLPEVIPIHFGATGEPDGWGDRWVILLLPFFGIALFGILRALARVPDSYNYPWAITPENAARQYRLARRFVLAFGLLVALIFLHLVIGTAAVALGRTAGLGRWSLAIDLLGVALLIGSYCVVAWRRR
jgi:uncharacterized membrane protein